MQRPPVRAAFGFGGDVLDLKDCGRVAQLVEQCPFKAWVAGSSPAALTKIFSHLRPGPASDEFQSIPQSF